MGKSHHKKKPATGGVTRLTLPCGHRTSYPAVWNHYAQHRGCGFTYVTGCGCGYGMVVIVRKSGTDVLISDNPLKAELLFDTLPMPDRLWADESGNLFYKPFDSKHQKDVERFIEEFSALPPPTNTTEKTVATLLRMYARSLGI